MKKRVIHSGILLLALVLLALVPVTTTQAAPGDFLFLWGAPQHLRDALGVAVDANDNVYVTMAESVQIFNNAGVRLKKWGSYGSGDGQVAYPNGITVDGSGAIYVADTRNSRVQVFDSDGHLLRKWSHPDWAASPPHWIATDGTLVYVAGFTNGMVNVFDSAGNFIRQLGSAGTGPGQYYGVGGLATDVDGNVYLTSWNSSRVLVFNRNGEFLRTAVESFLYSGLAVDRSGKIYVTRQGSPQGVVVEVHDNGGNLLKTVFHQADPDQQLDAAHSWLPKALAADSKGYVYTVDWYNDGVRAFDGTLSTELPQWWSYGTKAGQMSRPRGIATDRIGNVYETDGHDINTSLLNNRVQVFSREGNSLGKWKGPFAQTSGVTVDDDGKVYILDTSNPDSTVSAWHYPTSIVKVFDSSGTLLQEWGAPGENPDFYGIARDKNGNFLVSDRTKSVVQIYDRGGNFLKNLGSAGAGDGEFSSPAGIAVDQDGSVFVVDSGNSRIQKFDPTYRFVSKWGSPGRNDGQFSSPAGIAIDESGHVFVADTGRSRIQVFDRSGTFLKKWSGYGDGDGQLRNPEGVAVDSTGAKVYVADTGNNRIQVFEGYGPFTNYSISGTVHERSLTGPALAGVTVSIGSKTTTTDSSGAFSFTGIVAGTHTITIAKSGYVTNTNTGFVVSGNQSGLAFQLGTEYSFSGTVYMGSVDTPAPGATVSIDGASATTSSTGTFTVNSIPAGFHTISIMKQGYLTHTITGTAIDQDVTGVTFILTPTTYSISGTVRDGSESGPLLAGAIITVAGKSATTDINGAFSIADVTAGTYPLTISKAGYVTKTSPGFVIDSNRSNLVLLLQRACSLSGTVYMGSVYTPAPGAIVSIDDNSATTSSTGTFTVTNIPAGLHTLTIVKEGYVTYTVTPWGIDRDVSGAAFVLSPATYSISGTVRDGSETGPTLAGAAISIAGKTASTDSNGAFSISGLAAGTYTLTIAKEGYLPKTTTGFVISGNQSALAFWLSSGTTFTMSGSVRDGSTSGPALIGATVAVGELSTTTDGAGKFILRIPPGTYTLNVSMPGYATKTVTGFTVTGDSKWIFYLKSGYSLSGTVYRGSSSGPAVEGATVSVAGKTATTSSSGTFTIEGIAAGSHVLTISKAGYFDTMMPYSFDKDTSGAVFIINSQYCTISGTVHAGSAAGPLLEGATVSISGARAVTSSAGTFSIAGVRTGTYTLYISKPGYVTTSITGYAINNDASDLIFYLTAASSSFTVSGTIREGSSTGPVLEGATVSIAGKTATTGSAGTFSILDIPTGTYAVTISKAGYVTKNVTGFVVDRNKSLTYYLFRE